ncbi:MAG: SusC/RagA family TonB-linked outer membrane protein, partial [Bacteroidota bacterium]|nr:SusC/RagA family TonB-linked outer membrane protein [Bacteroidota bacterium]
MKKINYKLIFIRSFLLLCMLVGVNQGLLAQGFSVHGTVKDENGEKIIGANVLVKGTTNGSMTDEKGNYTLNNLKSGSTIVFSYIGCLTKEVVAGSNHMINVVLQERNEKLNEIVVVGYGSMEKKKITSSIANINSADFNKGNVSNPIQLLQGRVAGLNIVSPQGDPNGNFTVRLRGLSTLGENTQPLIIIDGVIGADLNSVDPNDIASIDVLKDGGAAAIYGTRGSSGVILITTKTGKKGKARLEYNGTFTVENKDRSLSVMDKDEYLANGGTDLGGNTNWMDAITRTASTQSHNVSLSGGSDQTTYMASLNYRDAEGVLLNTGFNQLNGRLNLTQKMLNDKLVVNLNLAQTSRKSKLGYQDAFRYAMMMPPSAPIYSDSSYYDKYGGYFQSEVSDLYNPYAIVKQNVNDEIKSRLMYNIQADYQILDGLKASVRYSHNNDNTTVGSYKSKYSYYGDGVNRNGLASKSASTNENDLFELTGNYTKTVDKFNMSLLAGYSYQKFTSEFFKTEGGDFLSDAFTYNNLSASGDYKNGKASAESSKESNKLIAFFGRANFNYANIIFLTASLRREGSSRFGSGNKWGYFPGISTGVDLNQ